MFEKTLTLQSLFFIILNELPYLILCLLTSFITLPIYHLSIFKLSDCFTVSYDKTNRTINIFRIYIFKSVNGKAILNQ